MNKQIVLFVVCCHCLSLVVNAGNQLSIKSFHRESASSLIKVSERPWYTPHLFVFPWLAFLFRSRDSHDKVLWIWTFRFIIMFLIFISSSIYLFIYFHMPVSTANSFIFKFNSGKTHSFQFRRLIKTHDYGWHNNAHRFKWNDGGNKSRPRGVASHVIYYETARREIDFS